MDAIDERERINRELREEAHLLLDNARGVLLSYQGPEKMKVELNRRYDKYESLVSDRSHRVKTVNLKNLIMFTKKLIVDAGGKLEDDAGATLEKPIQIVPKTQIPGSPVPDCTPTSEDTSKAVASPVPVEKAKPITSTPIVPQPLQVARLKLSAEIIKENATITEASPMKASEALKSETVQPKATVSAAMDVSKSEVIQHKVVIKDMISEAAKMKQKAQIPWRTPTRLEPLVPKCEQKIQKPMENVKKKTVKNLVKPIEKAKEPERLALKYKIKKRPAEDPLNDVQFKKPTLPVRQEQLYHRRHQLPSAAPQPNSRDPRTYAEYCQRRIETMSHQRRLEVQKQQHVDPRLHMARPVDKLASTQPLAAPPPTAQLNPLLPGPSHRQTAAARPANPAPVNSNPLLPRPSQILPKASVHPPSTPRTQVAPVTSPPKPANVDPRKTNPVYSTDEPIPLGKKEIPKNPILAKLSPVVLLKPLEELKETKTDDQQAKPDERSGQQDKPKDSLKENDLQKNLMELLKEIGDKDKVKQILEVIQKSDDEAEDKSKKKEALKLQESENKEGDPKENGNKEELTTKGKRGRKLKRIVNRELVDSSSEDEASKKEENKKEKPKKRATGGSREVSALIENVSDWISKGSDTHYTRRRGAIIQPTSVVLDSPPAKQAKGRKSNEKDECSVSDEELVAVEESAVAVPAVETTEVEVEIIADENTLLAGDDDSLLTVATTNAPPAPKRKQKNFIYNDRNAVHYNSPYSSNCVLCSFNGSAIVDHYVYEHKQYEVFVSRVSPKMSDIIRADLFLTNGSIVNEGGDDEMIRFKCYFCLAWKELSRNGWIEHMATHTGEYRYRCTSCPVMSKGQELESCFYHEKTCLKPSLALYNNIEFQDNHIYGFICNACNYIQIRRVNMERHLKREHPSSDIQCSRFSIVNYKIDAKPIIDEDHEMADLVPPTVMIPIHPKAEPLEPCEIVNQPFTEDEEMGEAECLSSPLAPQRRTDIRLESIHLDPSGVSIDLDHRPFSFKIEEDSFLLIGESPVSPESANDCGIQAPSSETEAGVPIMQIQSVQGGIDLNRVLVKRDKDSEYDSDASDKTTDFNMSDDADERNGESSSDGAKESNNEESKLRGESCAEFPLPFSIKIENDEEGKKNDKPLVQEIVIKAEKLDDIPMDSLPAEKELDFAEHVLQSTRIEHVAYAEHQSETLLLCLIPGCQFISKIVQDFTTHINLQHSTTIWDGYCHSCQSQIVIVDNCTITNELQHCLDVHVRRKPSTTDIPVSASNILRIRRIPGDTLSKDSEPSTLSPIMPTEGTIITSPFGMPGGSKPIGFTPVATISPVAGNTIISPTQNIPAQIRLITAPSTTATASQPPAFSPVSISTNTNVAPTPMLNPNFNTVRLKPWTNMVTTKSQEHCHCMLEETALLCLYKCMSRTCAFTTNNRYFMEQHVQLHESLHHNKTSGRKCWLECAYCDIIAANNNVLLAHIDAQHATCGYQCNQCFYRSGDPVDIIVHVNTYHTLATVQRKILIVPTHMKSFEQWKSMQESLGMSALPIQCTNGLSVPNS